MVTRDLGPYTRSTRTAQGSRRRDLGVGIYTRSTQDLAARRSVHVEPRRPARSAAMWWRVRLRWGGSARPSSFVVAGSLRIVVAGSLLRIVVVAAWIACLLTGASSRTGDGDVCARTWAEARAALDEYALVMDMAVAEDRARHDRAKPRFDAALAVLEEDDCAAAMVTRPALALMPAAVRAVHRAHGHITKDLLAGGRADRVRRATVHDAAGGWMYDLVDRLLDDIRVLPPAQHPHHLADDGGGDGMTAIHLAVLFREHWLLERFLALPLERAVVTALAAGAQGMYGMTPLHLAAVNADAAMVARLLEAGAPVDAVDAYGRTALAVAVLAGHDDVATVLADAGRSCPAAGVPTPQQCPSLLLLPPPPSRTGPASPSRPGPATPSRAGTTPMNCPVARVPVAVLDAATFERDFVSVRRPVVLEGAMDAWPVLAAWQPHRLRARYTDRRVRAGAIPYASVFGESDGHVRLGAFLDYLASVPALPAGTLTLPNAAGAGTVAEKATPPPPAYLFDSDILDTDRAFFEPDSNPLPPALTSLAGAGYPLVRQFFYGPALSGAPYHFHCDAVNALVRGRKRWLLLPPAPAFYSKTHPAHASTWGAFAGTETDRDGAYLCTQEAGELVYVPGFWGHATLNEAEAIGFAVEFDRGDC